MKKSYLLSLLFCLSIGVSGQNMMVFQPSGGANDSTDNGGLTSGKDTWTNRYSSSMNYGDIMTTAGSPRSNCNTSDYKAYFQFDLTGLPTVVDSVFFGVTHYPHNTYCYSNCIADFYIYKVTSSWNEMTLTQTTEPSEDSIAIHGPIPFSFPNDYQNKEYEITAAYNDWISTPASNFGLTVYSPTIGCNNAAVTFNVHTSDDTAAATRPYLKIYYPSQASLQEEEEIPLFYPNPFENFIFLPLNGDDWFAIYDITGRKVEVEYDESEQKIITEHLLPGVYILQVESHNKRAALKMVKQ